MFDTLILSKPGIVIFYTDKVIFLKIKTKIMKEIPKGYEYCIQLALDNAKMRIKILENSETSIDNADIVKDANDPKFLYSKLP